MTTFVLTVIGDDRSGLVDALAGVISTHGGNWERSQMARLAGKFAGIVEVTVPGAREDELRAALQPLTEQGLLAVTVDAATSTDQLDGPRFALTLIGTDRPGLVHSISGALASAGASIEALDTSTSEAPMSGGVLFEARARVVLPAGGSVDSVRTQLEALADHLMVDIDISD
jgi:glycine cleavage system regulatory protein